MRADAPYRRGPVCRPRGESLRLRSLVVFLAVGLSLYLLVRLSSPPAPVVASIDLQAALSDQRGQFKKVTPGRSFQFPRDHGEHPEFKTEWWYFTGNLEGADRSAFGYQLTLFRVGLSSPGQENPSHWAANSLMMGHFALSNLEEKKFRSFERFSRRALGLAGIDNVQGPRIWLENWNIERRESSWQILAEAKTEEGRNFSIALQLEDTKPVVLQGDGGYSRKGPRTEHASYYVSQTRLATSGQLVFENETFQVTGNSWFDHEWSSEAMAEGLAGWDWFSLQLDDNTELMLYLLRYDDGRLEPASSGSYIDAQGQKTDLSLNDFSVEKLSEHRSPRGVVYPSRWNINVPSLKLSLDVVPRMADQEMTSGVLYWEGAVSVQGTRADSALDGSGFVELTGY